MRTDVWLKAIGCNGMLSAIIGWSGLTGGGLVLSDALDDGAIGLANVAGGAVLQGMESIALGVM